MTVLPTTGVNDELNDEFPRGSFYRWFVGTSPPDKYPVQWVGRALIFLIVAGFFATMGTFWSIALALVWLSIAGVMGWVAVERFSRVPPHTATSRPTSKATRRDMSRQKQSVPARRRNQDWLTTWPLWGEPIWFVGVAVACALGVRRWMKKRNS